MVNTLIAGGSGFIGRHLSKKITESGGEATILTRNFSPSIPYKQITWNPHDSSGNLGELIGEFDLVVNLSGAGIDKKWTGNYKKEIMDSRFLTTSTLVKAINTSSNKPKYFVSASAVGYYGDAEEGSVDEDSEPGHDNFLADLCVRWEKEAREVDKSVKLLIPRFGVILGKDGGAFPQLLKGAKAGVTFKLKGKASWKSWIHVDDAVSSILFMTQKGYEGAYDAVSPNPLRLDGLMNLIAGQIGKKLRIKMGPTMANMMLGEGSRYSIFEGQKVVPKRLQELGFNFKYPGIEEALKDLTENAN